MKHHSFDVELAIKYGERAAIFIQHIAYNMELNEGNNTSHHDGFVWSYKTMEGFQHTYQYLSIGQIRNVLNKLKKLNIIKTALYNKNPYDKTLSYTIIDKEIRKYYKMGLKAPKAPFVTTNTSKRQKTHIELLKSADVIDYINIIEKNYKNNNKQEPNPDNQNLNQASLDKIKQEFKQ